MAVVACGVALGAASAVALVNALYDNGQLSEVCAPPHPTGQPPQSDHDPEHR